MEYEADIQDLLRRLVDTESVSGHETAVADLVEQSLADYPHLSLTRLGNVIVARTEFGRPTRIVIAGHLDTVPVAGNLPSRIETIDGRTALVGRGTCDMKAGVAVQLSLATSLSRAEHDLTWIFYDNEEVEASKNGLGLLGQARPDLLQADMAILMEPSDGWIEAGCQGSLRIRIRTSGVAAHSARSWLGHNAIHDMAGALTVLNDYEAMVVAVDSLSFREGLNAVDIRGGIAGNIIPDRCDLLVNYRFAPDKDVRQAESVVRGIFAGYDLDVVDASPAASPGLSTPLVASFVHTVGRVRPKFGWTDVARFTQLGIPALNFGPGDPNLAHSPGEHVFFDAVVECREILRRWLLTPA